MASFLALGITPLVVGQFFGLKWRLIVAILVLILWLLLRPWRLGLASPEERKGTRIAGTIGFAGWVLNYAISYFKW